MSGSGMSGGWTPRRRPDSNGPADWPVSNRRPTSIVAVFHRRWSRPARPEARRATPPSDGQRNDDDHARHLVRRPTASTTAPLTARHGLTPRSGVAPREDRDRADEPRPEVRCLERGGAGRDACLTHGARRRDPTDRAAFRHARPAAPTPRAAKSPLSPDRPGRNTRAPVRTRSHRSACQTKSRC
jgi:hypothetical protein